MAESVRRSFFAGRPSIKRVNETSPPPQLRSDRGEPARQRAPTLPLKRAFGGSFLAFVAIAVGAGTLCWRIEGEAAFDRVIAETVDLLVYIVPRVGGALVMAAFLQILVPREVVAKVIGEHAGFRGVLIATLAGALTPGGPLTSFPIMVALHAAGASKGALVAYLTSWAMLGMQRVLVWEFPLMGGEFTLLRLAASAILPVIAGAIAMRLPLSVPPLPGARR